MMRRIFISAIIAATLTTACVAALVFFPKSSALQVFIAIGVPLGSALMYILPDSIIYKIAPPGGLEATVSIITMSSFITIFLVLFLAAYLVRLRSIDKVESDGPVM